VTGVSFKASYEATSATRFHLTAWLCGQPVGVLAALSEAAREAHDLDDPVYFAEFHWDRLAAAAPDPAGVTYRPISRFPTVDRDLAVLVDERAEVGALLEIIRGADTGLLRHLHVFDVYKGERIPAGKKSVAFGLQFGADRTLLDEEVDRAVADLLRALESGCGAELRR
jgi:phenylalanyl-tRNA synthetase beta chain